MNNSNEERAAVILGEGYYTLCVVNVGLRDLISVAVINMREAVSQEPFSIDSERSNLPFRF